MSGLRKPFITARKQEALRNFLQHHQCRCQMGCIKALTKFSVIIASLIAIGTKKSRGFFSVDPQGDSLYAHG
jgi:hypothetical protein